MSAPRPLMLVDRDGTLIEEPEDFQVDSFAKLRLVEGVIPAMLRLRDAGWEFAMVTNQDGLGTDAFPQAAFNGPHQLLLQILASQGITFRDVFIDVHPEGPDQPWTRKPGIGMVAHLLKDRSIDWERSVVVGDRATDAELAQNLGVRCFLLPGPLTGDAQPTTDWAQIATDLIDAPRRARVERNTTETRIVAEVDLDQPGRSSIATGVGFFDHMLEQLAKHGGFSIRITCDGDLHIDEHHTVEDVGLALGQAIREALGDKRGIGRYGFTLPMDDTLASAALDLSGRAYLKFDCTFTREMVGDLPTEMVEHFWRSLCDAAALNLHLSVQGDNTHHQVEAGFKAVARALRQALPREGTELPTTKGLL